MGLVDRIERKLESTVGDAFARVFGGSIVPQEVEAMLHREADNGVREVGGGRLLAPNEYVITLSVPDYQKVSADPDLTSATFAKHLEGYIHEQGWQTYGDVVVRFEQSANLHTGQFRARGAVNPDSPTTGEHPPQPQPDRAYTAEPGVPPMSDNPSYRGGQGQGRPGDEYYDDRYARPRTSATAARIPAARTHRARPAAATRRRRAIPATAATPGYPDHGPGRLPATRAATPTRRGYPDQGGYPPQRGYEQRRRPVRPPAGRVAATPTGGYRAGARRLRRRQQWPAAATASRTAAVDYGRQPGRDRDQDDYGGRRRVPRPGRLPRAGRLPRPGRRLRPGLRRRPAYGRRTTAQPDYGRYGDTAARGYADPATASPRGGYDYGQQPPQAGYGGGYGAGRLPRRRRDGHAAARRRQRPHLPAARGRQRDRPRPGRPVPAARHRRVPPAPGDPLGRPGRAAVRPQLHQRHHGEQRAGAGVAAGRRRRDPARATPRSSSASTETRPVTPGDEAASFTLTPWPSKYRDVADVHRTTDAGTTGRDGEDVRCRD